MKIMHLLQSDKFSGAENVVCQIISMMKDKKNMEMVYCSRDGEIRREVEGRGIEFFPLTKLSISEVKRAIEQVKPEIIHAHDFNASFHASLVCGSIPLVSHIHNNDIKARKLTVKSIASIIPVIKSKQIFWVSESSFLQYRFKKMAKKKSGILRNIIDIDSLYEKMRLDTKVYNYDIVFVGRLTYPKNPERLIRVIEKVVIKNPNLKVAIVGAGDMEDITKKLVKELGMEDYVSFLGFCSNPLKIMNDAKVMLMTSIYEGTPMCALEAQALGLPIVSTPTDGLVEVIKDGENGFLSEDDNVLANKICELIQNEGLRTKMGDSAKLYAREIMNKEDYIMSIEKAYIASENGG